ncbi:DNRLRE domain-containing protein [Streptomyces montanisoli]|uniref:DNRLRE domain-containing protein n=1 Tax=Streptomyces montanisoli TaxID=2798581 RepID=A0A940MBR0_9ACTN|nr:DNRLRE domain-containing protein [Streptomyces montanisoli]MBP0457978.1 DNRLRE domain-containing protein [Streptomyces montanisoli]
MSTRPAELSKNEIEKAGREWATEHSKAGIPWALARAKKTGKKILVPNETTPTNLTYANPNGSLTSEITAGPERIEKDGKWIAVDATLHTAADGTIKAKAHPNDLTLAKGGGIRAASVRAAEDAAPRDLATLHGPEGEQVTLRWKGGLPSPELNGTTATYKDAVPGADVIVEATRTGFEQYTRLNKRPADGYSYTLPLQADGLRAKANADGSVTLTDAKTGAKKATMPAPVMWDAHVDKVSGKHDNRHRVGMKVVDHEAGNIDLVVTPDARWLDSPTTHYPVTIDPSTSVLGNTFDTYVQRGETTDLGSQTELDWGNPGTTNADGTTRVARSLMTWNTEPFSDALISSAKVEFYNTHSGNTDCTAHAWDVWDTTAGSSASRWTKQPDWLQKFATSTETKGNARGCSDTSAGWIKADVKNLVQTWASAKQTRGYMGIRAAEDQPKAWKIVNSRNAAANQPKLTVNYNYRPGDGTAQQAGPPFTSYNGVWGVNTLTPTLRDKFADADGDKVNGTFQVYDAETNKPITTPAGEGVLVSDFVEPGTWATVKVPAGQLVDGKTYKFRTNAFDGTHYNLNWSPWREFVVETAAAGQPTSLKPGDSYTITDRALISDPDKVEEVFKRDGNLEALGIKPNGQAATAKSVQPKAAWERTYTTPSTKFIRGRNPADPYQYISSVAECHNSSDSDNDSGWIKNRFSYCQETLTFLPAIKCGLWPPGCYVQGLFMSRNTLIGRGKIGGLDGSELTRYADFDMNVNVWTAEGDFNKPGASMKATLECEGSWQGGGGNDEEACDNGIHDGRTDTAAGWDADGDTQFDLWSSTPKLPDIADDEQIATGLFKPVLKFTIPGYGQVLPTEGEQGEIRFDSAVYNRRAPLGSVFPDATPAFRYDKSDTSNAGNGTQEPYLGVAAVANHIDEARKDPDSTYPKKDGKKLPGGSALDPLHRIAGVPGSIARARKDANRAVVSSLCKSDAVPGGPADGLDCDEYPFASTTEGAARYKYEGDQYKGDVSLRFIDSVENQEAGGRLGAWYENDRILNWDPFIVTIGD